MVQTSCTGLKGCEWLHACVLAKLCVKGWYYSPDITLHCQCLRVSQNLVHPAFHGVSLSSSYLHPFFITFHQLSVWVLAFNSTLHGVALHLKAHPNGLRLLFSHFVCPFSRQARGESAFHGAKTSEGSCALNPVHNPFGCFTASSFPRVVLALSTLATIAGRGALCRGWF